MARGVTFINNTGDTFTPTHSGAIATWVYEMANEARRAGVPAAVISRDAPQPAYPLEDLHLLAYPALPSNRVAHKLQHGARRVLGWAHDQQKRWAVRVGDEVARLGRHGDALVLNNDPELAVILGRRFPGAVVVHNFQNQNTCHRRFRRRYGREVDVPTAVSRYTACWEEAHFSLPAGSVRTLHSGVDARRFVPRPAGSPRPGLGDDVTLVNFVGLTNANKGVDTLLEALLALPVDPGGVALQILGSSHYGYDVPDSFGRRLDVLVAELRHRGVRVERPGFVARADLPARLARADVHVVPSRWPEPFGLVALEGMACGLATVVSDGGGLPEVVGEAALRFPPGDAPALAACLDRLLADRPRRADLARRGRQRAESMGWDRTWAVLEAALAQAGQPLGGCR